MNEELMTRVIHYLEGMQPYANLMRNYYDKKDLDDFDNNYLALYEAIEAVVTLQLQDPKSPLVTLMKCFQEFVVDYEDSMLYGCLEAIKNGYNKHHIYNEGKRHVYCRYLNEKYHLDATSILEAMDPDEFETFEKQIFKDFDIETLKKSSD